jgi:hypothetical protein
MEIKNSKFQISGDTLIIEEVHKIQFESEILKYIQKENYLVFIIKHSATNKNNVYCVDTNKYQIIWQIDAEKYKLHKDSPFENFSEADRKLQKKAFKCWTFDGVQMQVAYTNGEILKFDYIR